MAVYINCKPKLPQRKITLIFAVIFMLAAQIYYVAACSSRIFPKPRPTIASSSIVSNPVLDIPTSRTFATSSPSTTTSSTTTTSTTTTSTTPRPNITFPTYKCPATYDAWYCLNDATCFSVKIGEVIMYNCECASGFMGPRCEYKELDGSLLPKRPRPMLEMASMASGATCALLFVFFVCFTVYVRYDQRGGGNGSNKKHSRARTSRVEREECAGSGGTCRYCDDKQCCGDFDYMPGSKDGKAAKYRGGPALWQHIETIPMSFPIKRTTKI